MGDPSFWSTLGSIGRGIVGVAGTVAPIVGAIAAPFTGGASLALGAAIGAGARAIGAGWDAISQNVGSIPSMGGSGMPEVMPAAGPTYNTQPYYGLPQFTAPPRSVASTHGEAADIDYDEYEAMQEEPEEFEEEIPQAPQTRIPATIDRGFQVAIPAPAPPRGLAGAPPEVILAARLAKY